MVQFTKSCSCPPPHTEYIAVLGLFSSHGSAQIEGLDLDASGCLTPDAHLDAISV